jgi:hypothetical protein
MHVMPNAGSLADQDIVFNFRGGMNEDVFAGLF